MGNPTQLGAIWAMDTQKKDGRYLLPIEALSANF
jgi:hypothetical protein